MAHNLRIPLSEGEAVALLGRVKPTADMPRPGANPTKAKQKTTKKRKQQVKQ
jgi:hypothetical protein